MGTMLVGMILTTLFYSSHLKAEQEYITLQPTVLRMSDKGNRSISVICRQQPAPLNDDQYSLSIGRRLLKNGEIPDTAVEKLAKISVKSGSHIEETVPKQLKNRMKLGGISTVFNMTIKPVVCDDLNYEYECERQLKSGYVATARSRLRVDIKIPQISLEGTVSKDGKTLTLRCDTKTPLGMTLSSKTRGKWVWEINDGEEWLPAPPKEVSTEPLTVPTCLQMGPSSILTTNLANVKGCFRRYRCYTSMGPKSPVNNSQDYHYERPGADCNFIIKSDVPKVTLILALITAFVMLACFLANVYYWNLYKALLEKTKKRLEQAKLTPVVEPPKPTESETVVELKGDESTTIESSVDVSPEAGTEVAAEPVSTAASTTATTSEGDTSESDTAESSESTAV